ncbi:MAG: GNAT family N-acetyltransferase [Gemmatimonadaceae bacterium]|nr:GNAT family N-acetyltransferase [Gemmatimonadaceae bacterium]
MSHSSGVGESSRIEWQWAAFSELAPIELYEAMALRQRVFVVEQDCVYQDADGRDSAAWHLLGWATGSGKTTLFGYARVFEAGARYAEMSIGRIVSAPEVRGSGVGRAIVREAMRKCTELWPKQPIRIAAQRRLEQFYEAFGFAAAGDPYDEDGIDHIDMVKPA